MSTKSNTNGIGGRSAHILILGLFYLMPCIQVTFASSSAQAALFIPHRHRLLQKSEPTIPDIVHPEAQQDEVFLILVFLYLETMRQVTYVCFPRCLADLLISFPALCILGCSL